MSDYEERKQARIDRYRERAEKARQESQRFSHESISIRLKQQTFRTLKQVLVFFLMAVRRSKSCLRRSAVSSK